MENYYAPDTVAAALEILQRYDGPARVIGGGTDLLVETRRGLRRPLEAIVDASRIEGLEPYRRKATTSSSAAALPTRPS